MNAQALPSKLAESGWMPENGQGLFSCMAELAAALKPAAEPQSLCEALHKGRKDFSEADFLNAMVHLGFAAHKIKTPLSVLDERLLPCLFVAEDGKASVIRKKGEGTGNGTAWIFHPVAESHGSMAESTREASGQTWFRALLERFRPLFVQVAVCGFFIGVLSLAAPLFVMLVYDRVIGAHALETLWPLLIGGIIAATAELALRQMRAASLSWFAARVDYIVGAAVFGRLVKMPVLFTERASVSAQIARLKAFEAVRDFFTGPLFLALAELPFIPFILIALAFIAGPVAFVPLIAAAFYAGLVLYFRSPIRTAIRLSGKAASLRQQTVIETFEKMGGLRACGLTSVWFRQFRDQSGKASLAAFRAASLASTVEALSHGIYILSGMAALAWGVALAWNGAITSGALIAVMMLTWKALSPLQSLCNAIPRFEQLGNAIGQVNRLMEIETEKSESAAPSVLRDMRGHLVFSHVGLRYTKDSDPVFSGLSFEAKPGQLVAIAGGNGSGKSTVLRLVNGLYRPQAGTISIDGIDIRQTDPRDLRKHIIYVPQIPSVFHGSIADNLRLSDPLATDSMIEAALDKAGLMDYVHRLPAGIDTVIGTGAAQLPAVLSYNLGLARAYLREGRIMLFDELPYALLNSPAGEAFKSALREWKGRRTVLIVTHREDYLSMADSAFLLRAGAAPLTGRPDRIIEVLYESREKAA